ncbi:MAG: hypothetical protein GQ569_02835 [Methylococcaceae bacterium]|nr:hypothetical protein [Methylococcaceae bacterium]
MKYLIDVNVPDGLAVFQQENMYLVKNLDPKWSDRAIWHYAIEHELIIVTKDADFFHWSMATKQPPKVIHLKIGNMRLQAFTDWIDKNWQAIETLIISRSQAPAWECLSSSSA